MYHCPQFLLSKALVILTQLHFLSLWCSPFQAPNQFKALFAKVLIAVGSQIQSKHHLYHYKLTIYWRNEYLYNYTSWLTIVSATATVRYIIIFKVRRHLNLGEQRIHRLDNV